MIKYNGVENNYVIDKDILNRLLDLVNNYKLYDENYCTQESVNNLLSILNDFISNIKVESKETIKERKESEEEAREIFGEKFIDDFNNLYNRLAKEETFMSIHGTTIDIAKAIMTEGLKYKNSGILGTSVLQDMVFNNSNAEYNKYAELLNWPHRDYKGLVIIGIPIECFYKEPLWENIGTSETGIEYTSKIKPEYIVGYVDVLEKRIILNPNYKREHNYDGLEFDNDIYRENNTNNKEFIKEYNSFKENSMAVNEGNNNVENDNYYRSNETALENASIAIEEISRIVRSLSLLVERSGNTVISEEYYKTILSELLSNIKILKIAISNLKTNEQAQLDIKEREEKFANLQHEKEINDFSWDDEESWSRW